MAKIVVTKVGDILSVEYNGKCPRFDEYARNMAIKYVFSTTPILVYKSLNQF